MSYRRVRIKMLVGIWKEKGKSLGKLLFKAKEEGMDAGSAAFVSLSHRRLKKSLCCGGVEGSIWQQQLSAEDMGANAS